MVGGTRDGGWDRGWRVGQGIEGGTGDGGLEQGMVGRAGWWVGKGMVGGTGDGGWIHNQAEKSWLCWSRL